MSPEAFPKGFHVRKTIAFALVLALLLPIAVFWGWLVLSPKPPLLDGVPFSPLVLDRDGNLPAGRLRRAAFHPARLR